MATTTLNKLEALKEAYPDEKELESVLGKLLDTALNRHRGIKQEWSQGAAL